MQSPPGIVSDKRTFLGLQAAPSNSGAEIFCAEAIITDGATEYVALRWYASHDAVVGVEPGHLARTMCWQVVTRNCIERQAALMGAAAKQAADQAAQQPVVNYFYELLASRDELAAAGLVVDIGFWEAEYFVRCWKRGDRDRIRTYGPSTDPLVRNLRERILELRVPWLAVRPYGMPEIPNPPTACPRPRTAATAMPATSRRATTTTTTTTLGATRTEGNEDEGEERPLKRARLANEEAQMAGQQAAEVPMEQPEQQEQMTVHMDAEQEHLVVMGVELAEGQTEGVFHAYVDVDDLKRPVELVVRPQQQHLKYDVLVEQEEPHPCRVLMQAGAQRQQRVFVLPPLAEMPPVSPTRTPRGDSSGRDNSPGSDTGSRRGNDSGNGSGRGSGSDTGSDTNSSSSSEACIGGRGSGSDSSRGRGTGTGSGHRSASASASGSDGESRRGAESGSSSSDDSDNDSGDSGGVCVRGTARDGA
eukprot:m51a1_g4478 hypothetical protein (475) ;mRNA; r:262350-264214